MRRVTKWQRSGLLVAVCAIAAATTLGVHATVAPPAKIPIRNYPLGVAVGGGSAWISTHRDSILYRVDSKTNRIASRIDIGQNACGQVGFGFDRVWVAHCDTATSVVVIDALTEQIVGKVPAWPLTFAFGFGSAWMTGQLGDNGEILRVDPKTLEVQARIAVGHGATPFLTPNGVWSLNTEDGTVSRIDPTTNQVTKTTRYGEPGDAAAAFAGGSIWIQNASRHALYRFNPATGRTATVRVQFVGSADPFVAAGRGRVWVRLSDLRIAGFDIRTGKLRTVLRTQAPGGGYLALDHTSVWEPASLIDTVFRIPAP
jgi:virginiamycin B lyase